MTRVGVLELYKAVTSEKEELLQKADLFMTFSIVADLFS